MRLSVIDKTIRLLLLVVEFLPAMNYHLHTEKLSRLSAHLEELFSRISGCGQEPLSPELGDEIAATAGEVMVELADHRGEELARSVIEGARQLREVVRSTRPETLPAAEVGRTLLSDLEFFIRDDKRAA